MLRSSASDCRSCVCVGHGSGGGGLGGTDAVARAGARSVLVEAAGSEPQRACPRESGGRHWDQVLFVLVAYRLLAPGSEWRLHREWVQHSALADLLGEECGVAGGHKLQT